MKKLLFMALLPMLVFSCAKEEIAQDAAKSDQLESRARGNKVNVCHYDEDNNTWHVININENALPAHLNHGDVLLVDQDGDGFVEAENECVPGGDCNDADASIYPGAEEICGDEIDNNCDGQVDEDCECVQCPNNEGCCFCDYLDDFDLSLLNTYTDFSSESLGTWIVISDPSLGYGFNYRANPNNVVACTICLGDGPCFVVQGVPESISECIALVMGFEECLGEEIQTGSTPTSANQGPLAPEAQY